MALAFAFTNGFHDTANVVATSISTGALPPQLAVLIAALLNFAGAFISISVAATVANDVVDAAVITPTIVFAGLIGAIAWNLITWWQGLPSSSSHALIGGVVGSAVAAVGFDAVLAEGLVGKVLIPAVVAPIVAFLVAGLGIVLGNQDYGLGVSATAIVLFVLVVLNRMAHVIKPVIYRRLIVLSQRTDLDALMQEVRRVLGEEELHVLDVSSGFDRRQEQGELVFYTSLKNEHQLPRLTERVMQLDGVDVARWKLINVPH